MTPDVPRISAVSTTGPTRLSVAWEDGFLQDVELAGWIATGGDILAPLRERQVFQTARIGDYGRSVEWADNDDLAIDAVHLSHIGNEQEEFGPGNLIAWQSEVGLSNNEAADFLHVSLSTFNAYKAGAEFPAWVGMVCRAARRDPILLQAHYRPRTSGRPRKAG